MSRQSRFLLQKRALFQQSAVFDRNLHNVRLDRAAKLSNTKEYDYLRNHAAAGMFERLKDVRRDFPQVLDLGANAGALLSEIPNNPKLETIEHFCQVAPVPSILQRGTLPNPPGVKVATLVANHEELPFPDGTFDLVVTNLSLHWVNNLPGAFKEILRVMKSDGVFIGTMLGGSTLQELRSCFSVADQERRGGITSHISPMVHMNQIGDMLHSSGFSLLTIDTETVNIPYPDMFVLCSHLQGMGATNVNINREERSPMDVFLAAAASYDALYPLDHDAITSTFQLAHFIGWSPSSSQPKPAKRGSQTHSLKDIGTIEGESA